MDIRISILEFLRIEQLTQVEDFSPSVDFGVSVDHLIVLRSCLLLLNILRVIFSKKMQVGRNFLNLRRVVMIFDLDENFTNYSWDLRLTFGDNVKSAGPP
jgi:hypothetical protein